MDQSRVGRPRTILGTVRAGLKIINVRYELEHVTTTIERPTHSSRPHVTSHIHR
ncbi:hypothetical protein BDR06DRAFT_959815 [Suillus hirtellus]|nr:hypothetical protein BDR06DRAFT_959815 [Suillus hirtellus]